MKSSAEQLTLRTSPGCFMATKPQSATSAVNDLAARSKINADRARQELTAVQRALLQANALFAVIQFGVSEGADCNFDLHALSQLGQELSDTYAERAGDEADFFREVANG